MSVRRKFSNFFLIGRARRKKVGCDTRTLPHPEMVDRHYGLFPQGLYCNSFFILDIININPAPGGPTHSDSGSIPRNTSGIERCAKVCYFKGSQNFVSQYRRCGVCRSPPTWIVHGINSAFLAKRYFVDVTLFPYWLIADIHQEVFRDRRN